MLTPDAGQTPTPEHIIVAHMQEIVLTATGNASWKDNILPKLEDIA